MPRSRGNVEVLQGKATEKERETMNKKSKSIRDDVNYALMASEVRTEALNKIWDCLVTNLESLDAEAQLKPESVRELQLMALAQAQAYKNARDWLKLEL